MTFSEWAQQYIDSADILHERIENLKREVKTAPPSKLEELRFRIKTMQSMYNNCMEIADELKERKGEV